MALKIAYCTIASANYLPRVRVLEESLATHRPGASLHILLCERPEICRSLSAETGRPFVSPPQVCAAWLKMAFYYDITEYNTSLKPFFLEYLLGQGYDAVFYFDPDIEIFGSLAPIEALVENHDLILTPHVCEPMPMDGLKPGIDEIIKAGQFNLGFIGLSGRPETRQALSWWQEVCLEHCLFENPPGYFVDQFWAAILPSFISKFHCLRDPGCNMAYWNAFQRPLSLENGCWKAGGHDLKFFHFSGLTERDLTQVSRHQNRVSAPLGSPFHALLSGYYTKVRNNVWSKYGRLPYSFGQFIDGTPLSGEERKAFLRLERAARSRVGDAFAHPGAADPVGKGKPRFLVRLLRYVSARFLELAETVEKEGLIAALGRAAGYVGKALSSTLRGE